MEDYFNWDFSADEGEELYVPSGSIGLAEDGTVFADDIGSCVGIGIYDPEREVGYLSHLDTVSRDREDFMGQLNVFMELVPEIENPEVVLAGGAQPDVLDDIDSDFEDPTARDTYHVGGLKNTTARILTQTFSGNIEVDYPADQDTELYVESQKGIEIIHRT
jgi:hypothetical protein